MLMNNRTKIHTKICTHPPKALFSPLYLTDSHLCKDLDVCLPVFEEENVKSYSATFESFD